MRAKPVIVTAAAIFALISCNQSSPPNTSVEAARNAAAPSRNEAAPAAASARPPAGDAATGNGLWGVAEEEDEASHRGIDFIAFNRTGRTITSLSIRPDEGPLEPGAPENPWSANVLAGVELSDGVRSAAHYEADIELCTWQVRATFADRQTRDYPSVNLCDTIRIDLR